MIARLRWRGSDRASGLHVAALMSAALHGAALFAILVWLDREPPPEPTMDRGVEIVWDEAATEAVSTAAEAEAPGVPPGAEAPEVPEAAEPPAPPPTPPPPMRMAPAPSPPAPVRPPPAAMAAPPLDLPPTELPTADLAVAPPPPDAPPPEEAPPEEPRPEAQEPEPAVPTPPPPTPEPPRQQARPRPTPPRPAAPRAPEGARPGPDAAQQGVAGIGRATGAVTPPGPDARFQNAAPSYPEAARLRGEQGSVGLELSVGPDGRVITVGVTRSSGSPMLDAAARRTVADWRFRPATRDGEPVPGTIRTTIHFRLQ